VTNTEKRSYNITALQRGLKLLSLFAGPDTTYSATQLGKVSGLPASTLHRFLRNLQSADFLSVDEAGNYHLGMACVSLGQAAIGQLDVRRLSLPHLQELNHRTRETVHLTVRIGLSAVYVEKLDSPEPLRIHSRIGAMVPLYCSAVGKVLLAYLPEAEQAKLFDQLEIKRFTANTVGNLQELQTELRKVRKTGYACDLEEHEIHIRCIAAPIWDHGGNVNASLSITGPAFRMSLARLRQLAPLMQEVGLKISRELGYADRSKLSEVISLKTKATGNPDASRKQLIKQARKRRAAAI
jgi:IclR family acetate operon transcriptional repressor